MGKQLAMDVPETDAEGYLKYPQSWITQNIK